MSGAPFRIAILLLAAVGTLLTLSCSGDECTLNCNGDLRYPLALGLSWQYDLTRQKYNFRPYYDTTFWHPADSIMHWNITLSITNVDTIEAGVVIYEFHEVVTEATTLISQAYSWYANSGDGFWQYPDLGSGPGLSVFSLKPVAGAGPSATRTYKVLEYPLREGIQWELTNGYSDIGPIYKSVIGIGEQSVPAGKYDCYAVAWLWESISTITRTQYYSDVGLVRSRTEVKDLFHDPYENQEWAGTWDETEEIRLVRSPF